MREGELKQSQDLKNYTAPGPRPRFINPWIRRCYSSSFIWKLIDWWINWLISAWCSNDMHSSCKKKGGVSFFHFANKTKKNVTIQVSLKTRSKLRLNMVLREIFNVPFGDSHNIKMLHSVMRLWKAANVWRMFDNYDLWTARDTCCNILRSHERDFSMLSPISSYLWSFYPRSLLIDNVYKTGLLICRSFVFLVISFNIYLLFISI